MQSQIKAAQVYLALCWQATRKHQVHQLLQRHDLQESLESTPVVVRAPRCSQ